MHSRGHVVLAACKAWGVSKLTKVHSCKKEEEGYRLWEIRSRAMSLPRFLLSVFLAPVTAETNVLMLKT